MGGIASVTRSCLRALAQSDVDGDSGEAGVAVTRFVSLQSGSGRVLSGISPDLDFRSCAGRRLRFLAEVGLQVFNRPDWVLYEHVDLAQCQVLLPKALRSRFAIWGHGIELWRPLPRRKAQALHEADLLLFNSAFTRERAADFHPWILDRPFRVVPLCREREGDPGPGEASPANTPERKPDLLTVGRLVEDRPKGHLEILAAMADIREAIPEAHWHIVGDGPWRAALAEKVAASPQREHITLHGFVDEARLDELYRTCRAFAMPSRGEGFGLVYAEAMARGLPCIGSTLDAASEVIGKDGGACIDPDSPGALAETVVTILGESDESFRERSRRARARAEYFSLERFARDLRAALGER